MKSRIKNVLNYKKSGFWIIAVAVIVVVAVTIGLLANPEVRAETSTKAEQFLKYKTEYVGDAVKVGQIINVLDYPKEASYDYFELGTDSTPYSVTIHFKSDSKIEREEPFKRNAIIMFSLIGNVDLISFDISDGNSNNLLQYTRDWANDEMGRDVREFAKGETEYTQLLEILERFRGENSSADTFGGIDEPISVYIEKNISTILSSPKESSNPQDYINAHQNEYENILKLGDEH